jgi:signal transduction histidine kinase
MNGYSSKELLEGSIYGVLGFPVGLIWFIIYVPLVGTSIGLLPIGVGIVLLSLTLRLAGVTAAIDRWLLAEVLEIDVQAPIRMPPTAGRSRLIFDPLKDTSYWRELIHGLLRFPLALTAFVVALVWWTIPILIIVSLSLRWWDLNFWTLLLYAAAFLVFILGPLIVHGITMLQITATRSLLGPSRRDLTERVGLVEHKRDVSVETAESERRRIERDLHDGAQARLATVALDLGRAKRKLEQGGEPNDVAAIIDAAHEDAKAAIVELRDLARGIHPAVLTDRGLDAALSDVAARCTVPVHLDVRLSLRPAAHIESAAYFAVSELLANVSKHSKARNAWVTVRGDEEELRIDVSDDGLGGVDPSLGTGVSGLRERIASIDGILSVRSPLGSGTTTLIEIPMKSEHL